MIVVELRKLVVLDWIHSGVLFVETTERSFLWD